MEDRAGAFLGIPAAAWGFLTFSFAIFFTVYTFRVVAEWVFPWLVNHPNWRNKFLPIFPIWLGGIAGPLFRQFPFPGGFNAASSRIVLGIVAGGASGWAYKYLKAKLKSSANVDIGLSDPPAGTEVKVEVKVPPADKLPEGLERKDEHEH